MNTIPSKLTITDVAAASDGGSLALMSIDPEQREINFHLDRSFASQKNRTVQLYVDGIIVQKGSREETAWLDLLHNADTHYDDLEALDEGFVEDIRNFVNDLIEIVKSEAYQKGGYEFANLPHNY